MTFYSGSRSAIHLVQVLQPPENKSETTKFSADSCKLHRFPI